MVEWLALDVLGEEVLGVPFDSLLHLGLDWKQELVLRQGSDDVEVVVVYEFGRAVLGREELFVYVERWLGLFLLLLLLRRRLGRHWFSGLWFVAFVLFELALHHFVACHLLELLHFLEFGQGGPFVDGFLVVEAHLLVGLAQVEQPRLALDQGEDEVAILSLVLVSECDIDFSKVLGYPAGVGEDFYLLIAVLPVLMRPFPVDQVGNHVLHYLFLELRAALHAFPSDPGVSLRPGLEVRVEGLFNSHVLVVSLTFVHCFPQQDDLLLSLFDLYDVILLQSL